MITGLPIPPGLDGAVTAVGNCNTAMSMMVIGMILADINFKDFWDWTVVKYTIHRLVIIPAVVYIVCSFLPLSKNVLGLCVLLAAMPAGCLLYTSFSARAKRLLINPTISPVNIARTSHLMRFVISYRM